MRRCVRPRVVLGGACLVCMCERERRSTATARAEESCVSCQSLKQILISNLRGGLAASGGSRRGHRGSAHRGAVVLATDKASLGRLTLVHTSKTLTTPSLPDAADRSRLARGFSSWGLQHAKANASIILVRAKEARSRSAARGDLIEQHLLHHVRIFTRPDSRDSRHDPDREVQFARGPRAEASKA